MDGCTCVIRVLSGSRVHADGLQRMADGFVHDAVMAQCSVWIYHSHEMLTMLTFLWRYDVHTVVKDGAAG